MSTDKQQTATAEEKVEMEQEEGAAQSEAEKNRTKQRLRDMAMVLLTSSERGIADCIDGNTIVKSKAKKQWYIKDDDLASLSSEKDGRSVKYKLSDVIGKAESRLGHISLYEKIFDSREKLQLCAPNLWRDYVKEKFQLYARYLRDKYEKECSQHDEAVVKESQDETRANLQKKVDDMKHRWKCYEMELDDAEMRFMKAKGEARAKIEKEIREKNAEAIGIQFELAEEERQRKRFDGILKELGKKQAPVSGVAPAAAGSENEPPAKKKARTGH